MLDFAIRVADTPDVPAIVTLANANIYQNRAEQDRPSGFLTGVFSDALVRAMLGSAPSIVAYNSKS